jgi:hypothetical protein
MFGSVKYRRGKNLGRVYKLSGFFDSYSNLDKEFTKLLFESLETILFLTSVRFTPKKKTEKLIDKSSKLILNKFKSALVSNDNCMSFKYLLKKEKNEMEIKIKP